MKKLLAALFILNINTAWAHTGHSDNAFIFAFSAMAIIFVAKSVLGKSELGKSLLGKVLKIKPSE